MEKSAFLDLIQLIVDGDADAVAIMLREQPELALIRSSHGATRQESTEYFYPSIGHYLYSGDTALHMAAAAISRPIAEQFILCGADPRAKNRRGAEPLHYAADGDRLKARAQTDVIEYLVSVGGRSERGRWVGCSSAPSSCSPALACRVPGTARCRSRSAAEKRIGFDAIAPCGPDDRCQWKRH